MLMNHQIVQNANLSQNFDKKCVYNLALFSFDSSILIIKIYFWKYIGIGFISQFI